MNLPPRLKLILLVLPAFILISSASPSSPDDPGFEARAAHYLSSIPERAPGGFGMIAMIASGRSAEGSSLEHELAHVKRRLDCSDFIMAGFLRLLYLYGDDPRLPVKAKNALTDSALNFKYWIDEPGRDSMCYWSENHQVLYHSAEYLAGSMFPDRVFPNSGMTGREHAAKGKRLLEQWLDWRERFGFSEWLSNVYFDEELYPLANLVDFAPDPEIRVRAAMAIDQIALNLALNSFHGLFACTHGRTYEENVLTSSGDDVAQAIYLLWGVRAFTPDLASVSKSGVALATSSYRLPAAIECIGTEQPEEFENYQNHGLHIEEAPAHGIAYDDMGSGMFFWGMGMYSHPLVADLSARMWKEWDLYGNAFFLGLARSAVKLSETGRLAPLLAEHPAASAGAYLDGADTYTYRTPDYQLSSVLDRRPGEMGAQDLAWAAALGQDAFVFTTHPGRVPGGSPGQWTGNATNPRVAQHKNVLVAIYNAPSSPVLGELYRVPYTHAWFPRDKFDEVKSEGHWIFGRKGEGYVALYSSQNPLPVVLGRHSGRELRAFGLVNVFVCELGRKAVSGGFDRFVQSILSARVTADGPSVVYNSPSLGPIQFSWTGPFLVSGREIPLHRDMRYDNPYVQAPRFSDAISIRCGGHFLALDLVNHQRVLAP